jgi:hypothetical protein
MNSEGHFRGGAVHLLESENKFEAIRELIRKAPVFTEITDLTGLEEAVIASPPSDHLDYLMVLSSLARICYDSCFVKEAIEVLSENEVERRIAQLLKDSLKESKLKTYW